MPKTVVMSDEVMEVLRRSRIEGQVLTLPQQLERPLYEAVDKALKAAGGKWDKKAGGHVFAYDPSTLIASGLDAGAMVNRQQTLQYFPTPPDVVARMLWHASIQSGDTALEPSAGQGAIALPMLAEGAKVTAVEIDETNCQVLVDKLLALPVSTGSVDVIRGDFLEFAVNAALRLMTWDVVVMNPPFANGQAVDHVMAASTLLAPRGRLVAIVDEGVFFRESKRDQDFHEWLDTFDAETEQLEAGAFHDSGTEVRCRIVVVQRP